jgi:hypothetical protein
MSIKKPSWWTITQESKKAGHNVRPSVSSVASLPGGKLPVGVGSLGSIPVISHRTLTPKQSGVVKNPQVKKCKVGPCGS